MLLWAVLLLLVIVVVVCDCCKKGIIKKKFYLNNQMAEAICLEFGCFPFKNCVGWARESQRDWSMPAFQWILSCVRLERDSNVCVLNRIGRATRHCWYSTTNQLRTSITGHRMAQILIPTKTKWKLNAWSIDEKQRQNHQPSVRARAPKTATIPLSEFVMDSLLVTMHAFTSSINHRNNLSVIGFSSQFGVHFGRYRIKTDIADGSRCQAVNEWMNGHWNKRSRVKNWPISHSIGTEPVSAVRNAYKRRHIANKWTASLNQRKSFSRWTLLWRNQRYIEYVLRQ